MRMALLGRPALSVDERLALTLLIVALAGLAHAFAYTAAEGAHPSNRWIFHRSADLLAAIGVYVIVRIWLQR